MRSERLCVAALGLSMAWAPTKAVYAMSSGGAGGATIGPVTFACDDGSEVAVTFDNAPDPATVLLERGGQQAILPQAMSGSGARYVGDDITFWNKGRDAAVEWQGTKLECSEVE